MKNIFVEGRYVEAEMMHKFNAIRSGKGKVRNNVQIRRHSKVPIKLVIIVMHFFRFGELALLSVNRILIFKNDREKFFTNKSFNVISFWTK